MEILETRVYRGPNQYALWPVIRLKVDLIYQFICGRTFNVVRRAISTIPIVVGHCNDDLVASGIVKSLAHPGGNITGMSKLTPELTAKAA